MELYLLRTSRVRYKIGVWHSAYRKDGIWRVVNLARDLGTDNSAVDALGSQLHA